jgi:uncharacterized protein YprB with RNaseH-like and TPR domain
MYPSTINLTTWLTTTMNEITNTLIAEMEMKMSNDLQLLLNERQIKHKNVPQYINLAHLEYNCQIMLETLKKQFLDKLEALKKSSLKLHMNCKNSSSTVIPFKYYSSPMSSSQTKEFKSLLEISSHSLIYEQLKHLQKDLIFLDIETDGLNTFKSNVLSVCMITLDMHADPILSNKPIEDHFYIKPSSDYKVDINGEAYKVNKITQHTLDHLGNDLDMMGDYITYQLQNKIIVGFNINKFDIPCLRNNLKRHNKILPHLQTIDLYQAHHKYKKHNLATALMDLNCYPIPTHLQHTAIADAEACVRLLAAFTEKLNLPQTKEDYLTNAHGLSDKYNIFQLQV